MGKLAGANPSAEDGDDEGDAGETAERKIDLVHQFKLVECQYMNKKGFKEWLTDEEAEQQVEGGLMKEWKKELTNFAKFLLPQWKNVMIFHDVKEDIEGAKIFYVGDEKGDYFYYLKDLYRTDKF